MGVAGTGFVDDGTDYTPPVEPGCDATCGTPAGTVVDITDVDSAYNVILGRWEFCDDSWQHGINAPADAIGVEFGPASRAISANGSSTVGGKLYYLVAGPTGPRRGQGFAYQAAYDIAQSALPQVFIRPMPNVSAWITFRYSPCPTELEVRVFYETKTSTLVRFAPGHGVADGGADATPAAHDGGAADGHVAHYSCAPLPAGTPDTCGEAPGGTTSVPRSDARYPVGCTVSLTRENPSSPGIDYSCECNRAFSSGTGAPSWICPL
jgi:hypothetical protein